MVKQKKAIIGGLAFMLAAATLFGVWQWKNIRIASLYGTKSKQQISEQIQENANNTQQKLSTYGVTSFEILTPDQEEKLVHGDMSIEQAKEIILQDSKESGKEESVENQSENNSLSKEDTQKQIITKHLVALYTLKAEFLGKLGELYTKAKDDYIALPQAQRTKTKKLSIAMSYLIDVSNYENACDKKVEQVLNELYLELDAANGDTLVVEEIRSAYSKEKELKKAYYLSQIQ